MAVKKIMGYRIGDFTPENGSDPIHFVSLFTVSPADGVVGLVAEKHKVDSDDVLDGVGFGQFAELYFNEKQKVVFINTVEPTDDILVQFHELEPSADQIAEE